MMNQATRPAHRAAFRRMAYVMTLAALTAWGACTPAPAQDATDTAAVEAPMATAAPTTVLLVRHAEKAEENPTDPELTPGGADRASLLARMLADANVEHVWSTDTRRTRTTAEPAAMAAGLTVELYDPRDLAGFAEHLREMGGRHLVVGHSNTTPALVGALGGNPGSPIEEASEYDRLYHVSVGADGTATTTLLRFGAPYMP